MISYLQAVLPAEFMKQPAPENTNKNYLHRKSILLADIQMSLPEGRGQLLTAVSANLKHSFLQY